MGVKSTLSHPDPHPMLRSWSLSPQNTAAAHPGRQTPSQYSSAANSTVALDCLVVAAHTGPQPSQQLKAAVGEHRCLYNVLVGI